MARGSGPTRDAAKESAAARALSRLPPPCPALGHSNAPPGQSTTRRGALRAERCSAAADGVIIKPWTSQVSCWRAPYQAGGLGSRSDSGKEVKTTVHDQVQTRHSCTLTRHLKLQRESSHHTLVPLPPH
ncbi:hypothetical protein JVT61DRAFT_15165 [Boletus reticuloceps]|uniref:DRBM domain-containing protein n=1 Tax=Boletus reticuloceps TaxID=495285 RepID=A0A8I2YSN7_9AGAM|nr:hypothetical protein JVT61DRAFT_15165 [Boletus reticuloceps]